MGGTSSKDKRKDEFESFTSRVKSGIEDEIAKRMMLQREIQMSINIARARDTLQVFGSAWLTLVTGVTAATIAKRPVPHLVYVPIVVGGLALGNMADMAYGNKLQRVTKEAEYILTHEKYRFVPPVQVSTTTTTTTTFSLVGCGFFPLLVCEATNHCVF